MGLLASIDPFSPDASDLRKAAGLSLNEWQTPGKADAAAPIIGGTWQQHYPRAKGVRTLACLRTKAGLISPPAHVTDHANDNVLYGTTALRFVGTSTYEFRSNVGGAAGVMPAVDVTKGAVRVWVKSGPNWFNNRGQFRIRLYSEGSPASPSANYTEFDLGYMNGQIVVRDAVSWGPWQCFTVPGFNATLAADGLAGIAKGGTGAVATAVTYATLILSGNSTGVSVEVGDIQFIPNPRTKGAVIFTFDDGRLDTFTNAAEIMSRYGFPGVLMSGAPALEIGAASRLSVNQVRALQDVHGWQIASQSWSTEDLATVRALTEEQRTAFYGKLRAWHAAMGFRGGMDGSYYSGVSQSEPDMLPSLRQHFRTMRTYGGPPPTGQPILHFGECAPLSDPMRYRSVEFAASRFQVTNAYANDIKSYVDQAANNKGAAIFVTHNAFEAGNVQNLQNLRDMCADVYSRTDVEWLTLDDYIRSYS